MNQLFDFAGMASAIAISVGLALWLDWLMLRGFMRLMPGSAPQLKSAAVPIVSPADERRIRAKAA